MSVGGSALMHWLMMVARRNSSYGVAAVKPLAAVTGAFAAIKGALFGSSSHAICNQRSVWEQLATSSITSTLQSALNIGTQ